MSITRDEARREDWQNRVAGLCQRGRVRCEDGRLMRLDPPDRDGATGETDIGQCEVCEGNGCITCSRCGVTLGSRDEAEGCEDHDCGLRP